MQVDLITKGKFQEPGNLQHVSPNEANRVRAHSLNVGQVSKQFDRPIVFQAQLEFDRRFQNVGFEFLYPVDRRLCSRTDDFIAGFGRQCLRRVKAFCPFDHGALHLTDDDLGFCHGDIVAGALVTAKEDEFWESICEIRVQAGAILGSFEAWLLQRGMRTLFLRVQRASESALTIARHFEGHVSLDSVLYPGLPRHPGHAMAKRQMNGRFGGMLSLRVKGGERAALAIVKRCKVFTRATSLGGVESLIEHRYSIEGKQSPIPKDLLRLSIGIESVDDLIADLEQAIA